MVTLLLDHKADPRCLNNLGVMLTCLLFCDFILPEIRNMAKMEPFLEKEIPIGILIFGIYRLVFGWCKWIERSVIFLGAPYLGN